MTVIISHYILRVQISVSSTLILVFVRTDRCMKELFNLCFSALKKHGAGPCSLLKRLVFPFNKDSADLLSALLDFLRQIANTEAMVSIWLFSSCMFLMEAHVNYNCTCSQSNCKITVKGCN